MCASDENKTPLARLVSSVASGTAAGGAKASPGIIVTGLTFAGIRLEDWVTILTVVYLVFMAIGALPKVGEGVRYVIALARKERKK